MPLTFVAVFCLLGVVFVFNFAFSRNSMVIPVSYDNLGLPLIDVSFGKHACQLELVIGSRFPLFLNKKVLDSIDKIAMGTTTWHSESGQHETLTYSIPEIKVGELILRNIIATESDDDSYSYLGKFLGGEHNLLLDLPHSQIIVCDSLAKLKKRGIADWIQIPFEMGLVGPMIQVDTDIGSCKLVLGTGDRCNLMNKAIAPLERSFFSSAFHIGGHSFNKIYFYARPFPEGLEEIDGSLGVGFFKEHAVYLDYKHKMAYIQPSMDYFEKIPVSFSKRSAPIVHATIENKDLNLKLDLGSGIDFSLDPVIFESLEREHFGTAHWSDFKGNSYSAPMDVVPNIRIGGLRFTDSFVKAENLDFLINTCSNGVPEKKEGSIGLPFIKKYNLLLDFPNSVIYACNSIEVLQSKNLISCNLLRIPFVLHEDGILLNVETDTGSHRLILDTGATLVCMRSVEPPMTSSFSIGGHDFGSQEILQIDYTDSVDYDGCVGMDFLIKHRFFIDYTNRTIIFDLGTEARCEGCL